MFSDNVAFLSRKGINSMVLARSSLHLSSGEDEDFIRPGDQVHHHRTGMSPGSISDLGEAEAER